MYHNLEIPDQCETLWKTCQTLVAGLIDSCPIKTADLKITASKPIDPKSGSVYFIKSGTINELYAEHVVVMHEEGDLVGADGLVQEKLTTYANDFAVTVDEYDGNEFLNAIAKDENKLRLWSQYLSCLNQSYQILACHFNRQEGNFTPEFRHYDSGDVIIEEGSEGDEVFTLLSGTATVTSNSNQVGVINKNEIFGAIAALTNTRRTASIIAASKCDTIVVKSENFLNLLASRPDTVQKLIADMARTIVSSNEKIIELSNSRT